MPGGAAQLLGRRAERDVLDRRGGAGRGGESAWPVVGCEAGVSEEWVGRVLGARVAGGDWSGLPELVVGGLRGDDARALLGSVLTGPLDARVREQIVAETRGNPLALLELPRGLTAAELAGGFGLPARGTGPTPPPGPTKTSPRNWSARPAGRRDAAAWLRRRRSLSGLRC